MDVMTHNLAKSAAAVLAIAAAFSVTKAEAATPNAGAVLARALANAAGEKSVSISGTVVSSNTTFHLSGGVSPAGTIEITSVPGLGDAYVVLPTGTSVCFVKATSLVMLRNVLEVTSPASSEFGVWYEVTKSDPRYNFIASPGGGKTVAQMFSFSQDGFSRTATYDGATVLHGVSVIKLSTLSNANVSGAGWARTTFYVTSGSHPLPFAYAGPKGTTGLLYFSQWGNTKVSIPSARAKLPRTAARRMIRGLPPIS